MSNPYDPYADGPRADNPYGGAPNDATRQQAPWTSGPQWAGPPANGPQWTDPQYPSQYPADRNQWDQNQWGQQGPSWQPPAPAPASTRGRGRAVALGVAAVIVIGGGVGTYVAVGSSDSGGGHGSPKAAVQALVSDLQKSDLLGVLGELPPNERTAIGTPFTDSVDQLKRNDVVAPKASLSKVSGVAVTAKDLSYADPIVVNDHLQIVEITGGTATLNADALKLPLTDDVLDGIRDNRTTSKTSTVDFADYTRRHHHGLRLATEKVGSSWYPSLLYTIADNAATDAHEQPPSPADAIPAKGAPSADAAVKGVISDLLDGDVSDALALSSPTEDAVLHDYGPLIVKNASYHGSGFTLSKATFHDTPVDGGTDVALDSVTITGPDGESIAASRSGTGSCYTITTSGHTRTSCLSDYVKRLGSRLTSRQITAIDHLLSKVGDLGVRTGQVGGSWYVEPIQTYDSLASTLLSGLQNDDGKVLIELIKDS